MNLYLVRHGNAEMALDDNKRNLSEIGIKEVKSVGDQLKGKNILVDIIYQSGKSRAEQTASILSKSIKSQNGIEFLEGITPNDQVENIILFVSQSDQSIMLVGHLPFMNIISAQLTGLDYNDPRIQFPTATILCLEKNGLEWKYQWRITP